MILDPTLRLEVALTSTASADGLEFHVDYIVWNKYNVPSKPATTRGSISLGAAAVILNSPPAGLVYEPVRISVYNADNATNTATLRTSNGTVTKKIHSQAISADAGFHFEKGRGLY